MSELKINKYRYWLIFLLDDLDVGAVFEPRLLHVTFIPWFVTDAMSEEEIIESFNKQFRGLQSFTVKLDRKVMLGPDQDVPVNLLDRTPGILGLHNMSLEWFKKVGARWAVKNPHVDAEFIPHIRRRPGFGLQVGDSLNIMSLCLVKARRQEDGIRLIAAKVPFKL